MSGPVFYNLAKQSKGNAAANTLQRVLVLVLVNVAYS